MAFLDEHGLATFLAYLKAWVRGAFVSATGDQTVAGTKTFSNTIQGSVSGSAATAGTATSANSVPWSGVTGKPSELSYLSGVTSPIQLQLDAKAADSAVVHKTGNEGISGTKTFSSRIVGTIGKSHTGYVDMLQTYQSDNDGNRSCTIRCTNGNGYNELVLGVHDETNNAPSGISLRNTNGTVTATAPVPDSSANDTRIATTKWVNDKGYLTSHQDISGKVSKTGDTMTGQLGVVSNTVDYSTTSSSSREFWAYRINRVTTDTTHTGHLMRLGASQPANTKDFQIQLSLFNPRGGNLPTSSTISAGTDDSDASTGNCWGSIGIFYDYSKNRAYPRLGGCSDYAASDNDANSLATTKWVRSATGNFACNAATATAFASSKTVELTGAVTGTASSTGGWTVATKWRSCTLGRTTSGTANPWYKVASATLTAGGTNYLATFYVENCNTANRHFGMLRVQVGTNNSKIIESSSNVSFTWIVNSGFSVDDFVLVYPSTAQPTVEIWAKFSGSYLRRRFTVISEGTTTAASAFWTLYDTSSDGQAASITTQGTQVASSDPGGCTLTTSQTVSGTKTFSVNQILSATGFYKSAANSYAAFAGGSAIDKGARLVLYGESHSSTAGRFELHAASSTADVVLAGGAGGTLLWNGQTVQTSSDERIKTPLASVPDKVLDTWEAVNWGQFQFLDAVAEKGGSARLHLGLIAQHVKKVFEDRGLDACRYGIVCYEKEMDLWMIRYTEALAMEAACQRRRADRLEARIAALEERR